MFGEKLVSTLLWSAVPVAAAMAVDYLISIRLLHDPQGYTPLVTLAISLIVALPTTYALVSGGQALRKTRDELLAARDAAIAANRTKTQFLANMSHELRTPLNAILGFSELLSLDGFADRRAEYAQLIHDSGAHLLGLVDDLLDLARIEANKLTLRCEDVDLEVLIRETLATVAPRTQALTVIRTIEPELPWLFCDRRAIRQILLNLLTNAIKFTKAGGTIEVYARRDASGDLLFGVRDDGAGIAEEDQRRVFERFGQGRHDIAPVETGTGLGLPIVKGLAEAHGGRVGLESRVRRGTSVTVRLPAERLRSPADVQRPASFAMKNVG